MQSKSTAMSDLVNGYRRFRETGYAQERGRWDTLSKGQSPKTMVISCSDSRVGPTQIFDVSPGELFVVRNVAALVPPYETTPGQHGVSAALEFAVQFLKVEQIVVMGHGMCGGCQAALSRKLHESAPGEGGHVAHWVSMLDEARGPIADRYGTEGREAEQAMEYEAVRVSLSNLRTFPYVQETEASGDLIVRGAYFSIADGELQLLDESENEFRAA